MMQRDIAQYVHATPPVNLAAGALACDYVSLKNFNHVEVIISKAAGAVGEPPTFTFVQASAVAGTGVKAINFTKLTTKVGTQTGIGAPTLVTQSSGNTYAPAAGDTEVLAVIEFDAENFDVTNGFDCLSVTVADPGATAQWCSILFRLSEPRYDPMIKSAIAD